MAIEGQFEINLNILTFQNKVDSTRKPRLAKEKIKKKKQKNGIIVTTLCNRNVTRFVSSYNIP